MRIMNNIMALNAHRQLGANQAAGARSMEKLSSGLRINRAGDDAAGLAISEKMRGQIRGLKQASRNAQDAISLIQTAEGALNETHSILQRMRELAVQSSSDTNTSVDRNEIQKEMDQLAIELTRIANNTEFNTQTLMNGGIRDGALGELGFHIGANEGQFVTLGIGAMDAHALGVARDVASAELTSGVKISDVQMGTAVGSSVVDGAAITVSSQVVTGGVATAAEITGGAATLNTDLSGKDATITITVDGKEYSVDASNWDGSGDAAGVKSLLEGASDGLGGTLGEAATVTGDATGFTITSISTGATSNITFDITGTDAGLVETAFGITSGTTATGTAAGEDTLTVTFSDGDPANDVDVLGIALDATSISGTGAFAGITLVTDGSTLNDTLAASIDVTLQASTSATFAAGEKTGDAATSGGIDVSSRTAADSAITVIQDAIDTVSAERSKLGAYQNRLEHTIANLGTSAENLQAAESRIRDVDMAEEMMAFTKFQILQQASTAMLAQANMAPQSVLQLLG
ncbi:MAG: flagellin [Firmicutes bacterium]|nr:flagellin [Bacillota bacterium]